MERLWRVRSRVSSRGDFTRGTNEGASRPSESVGEGVALLLCGWGWGLKGAGLSTNPGDVSTGASEASEARCESREARVRGLSGPAGLRSTARKPRPARRLRLAAVLALGLRSLRRLALRAGRPFQSHPQQATSSPADSFARSARSVIPRALLAHHDRFASTRRMISLFLLQANPSRFWPRTRRRETTETLQNGPLSHRDVRVHLESR